MICLSKGLGAPMGSLIAGSAKFIEKAKIIKKTLGLSGIRQVAPFAAVGLHVLENHIERLEMDHENAKKVAKGIVRF